MGKLKLLLTDKEYRWITLAIWKLKIMLLPGIKDIVACYYAYKMYKKMQDMSRWEQYVEQKRLENTTKEICFMGALVRLKICMMAGNAAENRFQQARCDVLNNEVINDSKFKDFREWVEQIDSSEKDYSRIDQIVNSLTSK